VQPALVEPLRRWDPEQVGGYVIMGRLGAGAMGQVYLGRSPAGRLVAVKTIKSELAEEPDFRTRFGQEVAAARRVSGAFTAAVVAADSEADMPWLATVYVPAPSLSRLVRACGPLSVPAVRWLAAGCAEALESIHSVGLVHRDLKPANVLVSPDGPRVIDFGVARAAERIQLTVTRGSVGTPAYMAPEQARDTRQATAASDIFSLGATMLFAATGHAPYQGETVVDVLVRLATGPPDLTGLPPELAEIVEACLDRDPRNRPTSASILARLAPGLPASGELGSAPLARAALALIDEYRRISLTPADAASRDPADSLSDVVSLPSGAGGAVAVGVGTGIRNGTGSLTPVAAAGEEETLGSHPALRSAATTPGRRPGLPWRRIALALGSAVATAALLAAGWGIRTAVGAGAQQPLGPVLAPPPNGQGPPPGGPPSTVANSGAPFIGLNQDIGDSGTGFMVHGLNWPVHSTVTIALVGVSMSPIHPITDDAGTFNYVINQDHEFFAAGLPPGTYTIRVTDVAGASAEARFIVNRA
jgi:Protein kinase domain